VRQVFDYQDAKYAALYLDRVECVCGADPGPDYAASREAARYLALWMSYEDVIRVADLKTRRERLTRVRREVGARDGEPLRVTEYLKPGLDEVCSILPRWLAEPMRRRFKGREDALNVGLHIRTDTVSGFAMLSLLRAMRPLRPRTSRYASEQQAIERWLACVGDALGQSSKLALEVALCGNLVKGYGETSARGHRNLATILDDLRAHRTDDVDAQTDRVRRVRLAALAEPEGRSLAGSLGVPFAEPKPQPIHIVRRKPAIETR